MALPGTILKVNNEGDQIGQLLIRSPTLGLGSTPHTPPGSYGANSAPGKASKCTYDGWQGHFSRNKPEIYSDVIVSSLTWMIYQYLKY